ncbi:hypothetical protein HPC37_02905 [Pasteurellaceae bacterium 20609_3]|uniref:hypothetical protein n=1 Tax=Spirabiliibacterium mucosae TaxID=28156 RepID=UPI001AAD7E6A|nr:hypothetical protein [Spirabiliibacterium mucosae]MBE2897804.1 hypothetical protein [Spirabiliibacterium mucosae]
MNEKQFNLINALKGNAVKLKSGEKAYVMFATRGTGAAGFTPKPNPRVIEWAFDGKSKDSDPLNDIIAMWEESAPAKQAMAYVALFSVSDFDREDIDQLPSKAASIRDFIKMADEKVKSVSFFDVYTLSDFENAANDGEIDFDDLWLKVFYVEEN